MQDDIFGNVIFTYTREQALADGVIVDVSDFAKDFGFTIPVAVTANLLHTYLEPCDALLEYGQSYEGRLADVLTMLYFTIRALPKGSDTSRVSFTVIFLMQEESKAVPREIFLNAGVEGDSQGNPCITVFLPEDD